MSLLKRLQRIRKLSQYDLEKLDLTDALVERTALQPDGKANGVFLQDMTETEELEWERDHTLGWAKFKQQLADILKTKPDGPTTLT
jgi:hypothetical protein